ncbi:transmembrane protein 181-like isoform X2 [Amphiura filiformis]|uniref:transmembrane protein 181-like isoform X2 n=1 Tax=Amphiura filiformis TaxID=82378 RepID=UPI003B21E378
MRLDSSVQMRLYTLTKRQFVLVFICFFAAFVLTVLIGIAGPSIHVQSEEKILAKSPDVSGPYELQSPMVTRFNRSLWLTAIIRVEQKKAASFQDKFNLSVEVKGQCDDSTLEILTKTKANHSRTLSCKKGIECNELLLLYIGTFEYTNYIFTIHFYDLEDITAKVTELDFYFRSYNPSFSNMEIWFRFVFLVLSFIVTCMFAHSLRKFTMRDWSIEQKWMSVLLPLLLLYNDPIFPLVFLVDSWIPLVLDTIFQATFLSALLLFWLCAYHGIRHSDHKWVFFYLPKVTIVGLIWLSAILLACWQEYEARGDPTFNYKSDSGNYIGLISFFSVVGGLYLLYLIFLIIRAFTELKALPYMNLRLKFMTILMLFVVAVSISVTALRFGLSILDENFVTELSSYYENSVEFLAFYGLLNFYLYTMAFVYSPSKNAHKDSYFKDNPTFSMLNDSEDELIYGSDSDEARTSLTGPYQDSD